MVLAHASPTRLVFWSKRSIGPTVLTGLVLLVAGSLPLLDAGPMTPVRALTAAAIYAVALALIFIGRRHTEQVVVALDRGTLEIEGKSVPLTRARFVSLSSTGSTEEKAARSRYRAELVLEEAKRIVLLERADPAGVLLDLRRTLALWPLPVRSGWGLPDHAEPWKSGAPPRALESSQRQVEGGAPFVNERGAGVCILGGAVVVGVAMGLMHGARVQRGDPTGILSWVLSATTLAIMLGLALFFLTDRIEARLEDGKLVIDRLAFGLRRRLSSLSASEVTGVYAVGVDPDVPQHLLLDAGSALRAFPLAGEPARRFARALGRRSFTDPAESRPARSEARSSAADPSSAARRS